MQPFVGGVWFGEIAVVLDLLGWIGCEAFCLELAVMFKSVDRSNYR